MRFGHQKILFFKFHERLGSRVSLLRCVILRHFEELKMRFLKCPETFGSMLCDYRWAILDKFDALKMLFLSTLRPWAQGYVTSSGNLNSILVTWKCDYSSVIRPTTTIIHKASIRSFGCLKMRFFKCPLGWRIHGFRWPTFLYFGGLKKGFRPCR